AAFSATTATARGNALRSARWSDSAENQDRDARRDWQIYTCSNHPIFGDRREGGLEIRLRISPSGNPQRPQIGRSLCDFVRRQPVISFDRNLGAVTTSFDRNFQNLVGIIFVRQLDRRTLRQKRRKLH